MKNLTLLLTIFICISCKKENKTTIPKSPITDNTSYAISSHSGKIIGTFRSFGGGIGISVDDSKFGSVKYNGNINVVEALNIPKTIPLNTIIHFDARFAFETEKSFIKSADGFEGAPIISVMKYSVELPDVDTTTSACVLDKINDYKTQGNYPEVVIVLQYYYKNKICYLLYSNCCDRYNTLVDSNCTRICSPSGGLDGTGDGTCPDFDTDAIFIREVWSYRP